MGSNAQACCCGGCGAACSYCSANTPDHWNVAFSGITLGGVGPFGPFNSFGTDYWIKFNYSPSDANGTFSVPQTASPCVWELITTLTDGSGHAVTATSYLDAACTIPDTSTSSFRIGVSKYGATEYQIDFSTESLGFVGVAMIYRHTLVDSPSVIGMADCMAMTLSSTNQMSAVGATDVAFERNVASGGSASAVPVC